MSNGMNTASGCSGNELRTDGSTKPQSSAISAHSSLMGTPERIRDWLTSLPPDSPASRSLLRGSREERRTSGICGRKPLNAYAWYDRATSSWRTSQASLLEDTLEPFSGELAESGFDAKWRVLSAAEVGAPHKRDRLWIVAHSTGERCGETGKYFSRSQERTDWVYQESSYADCDHEKEIGKIPRGE
jgi:hypothetical protein